MNAIETLERFEPRNGDRLLVKHCAETLLDKVFPISEIPEDLRKKIDSDFDKITIEPDGENVVITCFLKF